MAYPRRADKAYLSRDVPPFLQASQVDLFKINGLHGTGFTWAQCYPQKMWGTQQYTCSTAENAGRRRYSHCNQGLSHGSPGLRTSFSTVCVKSSPGIGAEEVEEPGCRALEVHGVAGNPALLKMTARDFFFFKSRALCWRKTLPHNFVHRKCEETHLRQGAT